MEPFRIYSKMPSSSSPSPLRVLRIFLFFTLTSLVGGAVIGIVVVRWGLSQGEGFLFSLIENHGGSTVVRRIQTLTAVALAPWLLKQIGWKGFSDLGWQAPKTEAFRSAAQGYVLGLLCMGGLLALSLLANARLVEPDEGVNLWLKVASGFLITGIGIGILEESMARGALFRSLARSTTPWLACLLTSLLFSYVHFAEIEHAETFSRGIWPSVQASLIGEFILENKGPLIMEFINLAVLGIVLCRMVSLKGHIWLAVGFHASAVGMIKAIAVLTNVNHGVVYNPWIGHGSGFLDGRGVLLFLGLLLGIIEFCILRKSQNQQKQKTSPEL